MDNIQNALYFSISLQQIHTITIYLTQFCRIIYPLLHEHLLWSWNLFDLRLGQSQLNPKKNLAHYHRIELC